MGENLVCIQCHYFQRNIKVQGCHQFVLLMTNACLIEQPMSSGKESQQNSCSNDQKMCVEPILGVLVGV